MRHKLLQLFLAWNHSSVIVMEPRRYEPRRGVAIHICLWRIDIREIIGALYLPVHHPEIQRLCLTHRQHRPVHDPFTHYVFHEEF